jgi:hypothetical protein
MLRRATAALAAIACAGCTAPAAVPANVRFGAGPLPAPAHAQNEAAPGIQAMRFSSDEVRRGETWRGEIVTPTNVASVEVRTNLFSIDVPRRKFGDFAFSLRVFDVPPIFIRSYRVRVIARNSAGRTFEEDLPLRIR